MGGTTHKLRPSPYLLQVTSRTLFFPVWNYPPHTFRSERTLESHNLTGSDTGLVPSKFPSTKEKTACMTVDHARIMEQFSDLLHDSCLSMSKWCMEPKDIMFWIRISYPIHDELQDLLASLWMDLWVWLSLRRVMHGIGAICFTSLSKPVSK